MLVWCLLWAAALGSLVLGLALARYHAVHNRTFDLALYARMAWGLVHLEPWDPIVGGNFLGGHRPVLLLPLGALGAVFDTASVLLTAQALALASCALPLFFFASTRLGPRVAALLAGASLLYPTLTHVATYEFHPGSLALPALCVALVALDREWVRPFWIACVLALACRASLALEVACLSVLALARGGPLRRSGRVLLAASVGYFAISLLWLTPMFGGSAGASLDLHFGQWGGSPLGVLPTLLSEPERVLEHFTQPARIAYPARVLAPLAFLSLASPRLLLPALPALLLNLLSQFPTALELYSHYLSPAVPALLCSAIDGAHRIARRFPPAARAVVPSALAVGLGTASVLGGGLPWSRDFRARDFRADADTEQRLAVLAAIPADASVQAPDPLLPHLAERAAVHRAPPPERGTDFVVLDSSHRQRYAHSEDLLRTTEEPIARRWLARADHGLVLARPSYLVLRRGADPRAGPAAAHLIGHADPRQGQELCNCLSLLDADLAGSRLKLTLVAQRPCPSDLALRLGPSRRPSRVDLLFDGVLSPAHLQRSDMVRSSHPLSPVERQAIAARGLRVGVLRSSGARPDPADPVSVRAAF